MTLEELRKLYLAKGPHDTGIREWVLKNIERYVTRKRYPNSLCPLPAAEWGREAFVLLLNDFQLGRHVRDRKTGKTRIILDFNLPEIFDRCDTIEDANALVQQQIHFYFQKARAVGIRENIVRRINAICNDHPQLKIWAKGTSATYGLKRWTVSPVTVWEGSDSELYHITYANLGEYVPKVYSEYSAYNSPEISDKKLTEFLLNIFSSVDRRLTINQIMFILGHKLEINVIQDESLDQETENRPRLLETVPADVSNPEETVIQREKDAEYSRMADSFYSGLPAQLQDLLTFMLQNRGTLEELSKEKHVPLSTLYDQRAQLKTRFGNFVKTPYDQKIIQQKLLEKFSPRRNSLR